jgi:hypothetical protein
MENRMKPVYRSTSETMPQGMASSFAPSVAKSPLINAQPIMPVIAMIPRNETTFDNFMIFSLIKQNFYEDSLIVFNNIPLV